MGGLAYCHVLTSQFVAVNGTFEKIQPVRDGRSDASRMYLSSSLSIACGRASSPDLTCLLLL